MSGRAGSCRVAQRTDGADGLVGAGENGTFHANAIITNWHGKIPMSTKGEKDRRERGPFQVKIVMILIRRDADNGAN
jgi:hypothetical protein